jgi:hypothetical protein
MSEPHVLRVEALLAENEKPVMISAVQQLAQVLGKASNETWTLNLRWFATADELGRSEPTDATVISLLRFMDSEAPAVDVEAQVGADLAALAGRGVEPIHLINVFRHIGPDADPALRERARRLNLAAVRLSHSHGAFLADIDKVFAHIGARQIETDYRLAGRKAAETAGWVLATSILAAGLDRSASPQTQEQALALHGTLADIGLIVGRRLAGGNPGGN